MLDKIIEDLKVLCNSEENNVIDSTPMGDVSMKKLSTLVFTDVKGSYSVKEYEGIPKILVIINQTTNQKVGVTASEYKKHKVNKKSLSIELNDGTKLKLAI